MQAQLALLAFGAALLVGAATRGFAVEVAAPSPACPAGARLTYDNFGRAFVDPSCTGCHGAGPPTVTAETAPPAARASSALPAADRRRLGAWLVFDAP